jgi:energy-converting hydrogenase A subunit K
MNKEKDFLLLASIVAIGVVILSLIVSYYDMIIILPVAILGIMLFLLIILQIYPKVSHISEKLENIVFIITLFAIIFSFIFLYKPA